MIEKATGIILRTRTLTETSLIVHWLTREWGRLATVAKGARRPRSPFRGKLDLFYLADLSFWRSPRSDLHPLREVVVRASPPALRENLAYLRQAAYCAALLEQTTETETPIPALFDLLCGLLDHLPAGPAQPRTVLGFELKLLAELGLRPDVARTRLSPGSRRLLEQLVTADWTLLARLRLTDAQTAELAQFLHGFLVFHLGKVAAGRGAALGPDE